MEVFFKMGTCQPDASQQNAASSVDEPEMDVICLMTAILQLEQVVKLNKVSIRYMTALFWMN